MADKTPHPFFDLHTHGFVRVATSTPQVRTADIASEGMKRVSTVEMGDAVLAAFEHYQA